METPAGIIPAVRNLKDFEKALRSQHDWIAILEVRLGQIQALVEYARKANKKVMVHIDLILGLKADEYGVEFLVNHIKPDGVISTRSSVVTLAKKKKMLAIQRIFLLDSLSLEHHILSGRFRPDFIELLPGKLPEIIKEIQHQTTIPIIAGGLISTKEDIEAALAAGAVAVSTSAVELW